MNAIPISVQQVQGDATELKARAADNENLEFAAQAIVGLKVILGIAAVVTITLATSAFMIWLSPFWAHWF